MIAKIAVSRSIASAAIVGLAGGLVLALSLVASAEPRPGGPPPPPADAQKLEQLQHKVDRLEERLSALERARVPAVVMREEKGRVSLPKGWRCSRTNGFLSCQGPMGEGTIAP